MTLFLNYTGRIIHQSIRQKKSNAISGGTLNSDNSNPSNNSFKINFKKRIVPKNNIKFIL